MSTARPGLEKLIEEKQNAWLLIHDRTSEVNTSLLDLDRELNVQHTNYEITKRQWGAFEEEVALIPYVGETADRLFEMIQCIWEDVGIVEKELERYKTLSKRKEAIDRYEFEQMRKAELERREQEKLQRREAEEKRRKVMEEKRRREEEERKKREELKRKQQEEKRKEKEEKKKKQKESGMGFLDKIFAQPSSEQVYVSAFGGAPLPPSAIERSVASVPQQQRKEQQQQQHQQHPQQQQSSPEVEEHPVAKEDPFDSLFSSSTAEEYVPAVAPKSPQLSSKLQVNKEESASAKAEKDPFTELFEGADVSPEYVTAKEHK